MSWQGLYGVDEVALQFARANRRKRLGGSFLFVGPHGIGKRSFAFALAKTLLCRRQFQPSSSSDEYFQNSNDAPRTEHSQAAELAAFQPCGECECCRQFEFRPESPELIIPTHPDFHYVCKPPEKSLLPLEALVGPKDERMRSGLCFELNKTAYMGGRKIAVIDDADYFNQESANALLKTLEEPPANSIIILIGSSAAKQLPTIRSRCQIFRFMPLPDDAVADVLLRQGKVGSQEEARAIARAAAGSLVEAERALDDQFDDFKRTLLQLLRRVRVPGVDLATRVCEYVDGAGKEAVLRRRRLQNVLNCALAFFRDVYAAIESYSKRKDASTFDVEIANFARQIVESDATDVDQALWRIERTLDALEQIDRNVNLPFIVEAWAYEIAGSTRA